MLAGWMMTGQLSLCVVWLLGVPVVVPLLPVVLLARLVLVVVVVHLRLLVMLAVVLVMLLAVVLVPLLLVVLLPLHQQQQPHCQQQARHEGGVSWADSPTKFS